MTHNVHTQHEQYLAALDIGSNSFHFVLARHVNQQIQILHAEKYRVQLAQGLDNTFTLSSKAIARGINALEKLATSSQHITPDNFRAVATYTLRQATNAEQFLTAAKRIFPFTIEIISGHEEARLIYQGVAHHRQTNEQQLVIDIGGGSTECIIGQAYQIKTLDSLQLGCVSYQQAFFSDHVISQQAFERAIRSASHQVDSIIKRFANTGWQHAIGTSGTIKAIAKIINAEQEISREITLEDVENLKATLLTFQHFDEIDLPTLKETRRNVLCSGVAILLAIMRCFDIKTLGYCQYALREGVLFEQLENLKHNNVRQRTVESFISRFNIDFHQAENVKSQAVDIYQQVAESWQLTAPIYLELLTFAAQLHELGVDINASSYQKHGKYIIEQADMAGFNQEQQYALAWLVGNQRKKISPYNVTTEYTLTHQTLHKLCVILRFSVLLNQQRYTQADLNLKVNGINNRFEVYLDKQWLIDRPIISTELFYEQQILEAINVTLIVQSNKY
ncbi:Ppx/GppA phosphatase family protein [Thalassotalea hakodatensis]|uniref:Ppx/GppA phosphatase family protein n=1 Tax=Thalassotalea hakodatensis TaxID=3030492 RepID=UPI002573EFF8|nr:Ppx/GppA phosphatase family protein [Thalassotalea hakodatensis]